MEKRNKLILIILLIVILVPIAYFGISVYLHDLEEKTFYEGIKNISDIENRSDIEDAKLNNHTSLLIKDVKNKNIKSINVTSTEIEILNDLKSKVSNKSYIEYIDIQINRLNCENRTYTISLESDEAYEKFQKGQIGVYEGLAIVEDNKKESNAYVNKVKEYKVSADSFLSVHTDMKERFNKLGIDEDFLYNQIEEVKVESIN